MGLLVTAATGALPGFGRVSAAGLTHQDFADLLEFLRQPDAGLLKK
jgi:hypothetical protein